MPRNMRIGYPTWGEIERIKAINEELLSALEELTDYCVEIDGRDNSCDPQNTKLIAECRAVIAKAKE